MDLAEAWVHLMETAEEAGMQLYGREAYEFYEKTIEAGDLIAKALGITYAIEPKKTMRKVTKGDLV